jgi:uncharacterized membrane protein YqjE
MDRSSGSTMPLLGAARQLIHRVLSIGENRFQLFVVELEEERVRLQDMVLLTVAVAALGMLGAIAFSAALVIIFWHSALIVLLALGAFYGLLAFALARRLTKMRCHQTTLAATLDQLKKDRACFTKS